MPHLIDVAKSFRAELIAGEDRNAQQMLDALAPVVTRLDRELTTILGEISRQGVDPVRLFEERRLERILAQYSGQIAAYAASAGDKITARQKELVQLAQRHGQAMADAALGDHPSGYEGPVWQDVNSGHLEALVGVTADGGPIHKELQRVGVKAVDAVRQALVTGAGLGQTPEEIAATVHKELDGHAGQFITIARTADAQAYQASQQQFYEANQDIVVGWRWMAALAKNTCPACLAMHGRIFPVTATMDRHFNCRCVSVPVTKTWAELGYPHVKEERRSQWISGEEWLRSQSEADQIAVLGRGKWELWKAGKIDIEDCLVHKDIPNWGGMYFEAGIKQAEDNANDPGGGPGSTLPPAPKSTQPAPRAAVPVSPGQPGVSVSSAFDNLLTGDVRDEFQAAVAAADSVHGLTGHIAGITPLRVDFPDPQTLANMVGADGAYVRRKDPNDPALSTRVAIYANPAMPSGIPRHVLIHEMGHYLHHVAIGDPGKMDVSGDMTGVFEAIGRSQRILQMKADLAAKRHKLSRQKSNLLPTLDNEIKFLEYLTNDREMWARAYAQFVTIRSGDPVLMRDLKSLQSANRLGAIQWLDDDFKEIETEIEKMFQALGWIA